MALQQQSFANFTATQWAALIAKVKEDTGATIVGDVGTVKHGSITIDYKYDPQINLLILQCMKKPLLVPSSTIVNGITEEIAELQASVK